ncbi:hypothetical protein P5673_021472 [Acropora cervicornis]|uniref:Insulin-like domain-containing protein n=1 Tax=Acropora cervicornis TaxID=6130 RepID=A0AAD9Q8A1_ACRCE|nr:hypothetical protein P5673_021472 [Acropora cervicornis]
MEARLGFLVFALLLVLYLPLTTGKRKCGRHQVCMYKAHEVSPYPITFKVCGDNIISLYNGVCFPRFPAKRRKRRGLKAEVVVESKNEALDFLSHKRRRRRSSRRGTNILEECCNEGCRVEEVREYC